MLTRSSERILIQCAILVQYMFGNYTIDECKCSNIAMSVLLYKNLISMALTELSMGA